MRRFFRRRSHDANEELHLKPEDLVTVTYQALLGREPDLGGLKTFSDAIRHGRDVSWLLRSFVQSEEFALYHFNPGFSLETAPSMDVQIGGITPGAQAALWDHIASVWSALGSTDPFWSVLTDERWRSKNMTDEQKIEAFYATGEGDLLRLDGWLSRNSVKLTSEAVCAEYGCGVGRLTQWLAKRFRRVVAFDISEPHLQAARDRLSRLAIDNVDFILVRGIGDLRMLCNIDLFYSFIVLQHNPPPIIAKILSSAFAGLNEGGCCFFQVPTFSTGYRFSLDCYWANLAQRKQMEMHFLPQKIVFELGRKHNVHPIEIQRDGWIGKRKDWVSNTFLMGKQKG
jgi:SAM-dependent methyltransferase